VSIEEVDKLKENNIKLERKEELEEEDIYKHFNI